MTAPNQGLRAMTETETVVRGRCPAICGRCSEHSAVRPHGKTPPGWSRADGDRANYYCPSCTSERAAGVSW